jgi:hypothetical protein
MLDEIERALSCARMVTRRKRRFGRKLVDVGARRLGFVTSAGENDGAYGVVVLELVENRVKGVERRAVESVQNLWPVDRDRRDRRAALDEQIVKGHFGHELYPTQ